MKNKKLILTGAIVVCLLCVGFILCRLLSPGMKAKEADKVFTQESSNDEDWKVIKEGEVVLENENLLFQMDSQTSHFIITDKVNGKRYSSVAEAGEGFEPKEEQQSELVVTYYDANSVKLTMNSYENCIQGENFEVKTDGESIRVYYSIQKSKQKIFVPTVISQDTFENELLPKLETGPKRRLKGFYNLNEGEKRYELSDSAGEHNYSEITGYMDDAGYTPEQYAKDAEKMGIDSSASENMPAAFLIPVEYTLCEEGISATILTDKMTSDSGNYYLTNIQLLPYFGSCGYTEEGWMLVPDGSGAIIELADKEAATYSQSIYGCDMAVESSVKAAIMQNAGLPVFAMHNGEEAFFAEVTGGAAVATISAETFGNEIMQSHIYADFNVLAFDTSDMGALRNQAVFNLYAKEYVTEFPEVTYTLFPEKDVTYSDMANVYREQLTERGALKERLKEKENLPIYLDFTGYETTDESFMGISVEGKQILSTVEEIQTALKELEKRGVSEYQVRLKAYTHGGIYHEMSDGFEIVRQVGTKKELKNLAETLQADGGMLYLENNISTVYQTGGSFQKMTHAVRNLRKTVVEAFDYDLVARTKTEAERDYFLVSPAYFASLTERYFASLKKAYQDTELYGYSWSDYGSKLYSDFHGTTAYDRTQAVYAAKEAMKNAAAQSAGTLTDGSNAYVLSDVSAVLNIPLRSSSLSCESYSVPFYQMVVHGYIDYAGAPLNTGGDMEGNYLASIESGANPYYSFYTSKEEPLKKTQAGTLIYPTYIGDSYDKVEEQYQVFNETFESLRTQTIKSHERIADKVYATTYEDGTKIVVNYNEKETEIYGQTIPANGFIVQKGGENS